MIGKSALIPSDSLTLNEGETTRGAIGADAPASNVNVNIFDGAGNLVKSLPIGVVNNDLQEFSWDGTDASGNQVPGGEYFFSVVGTQGGDSVALDSYAYKEIESVSLGQNSNSVRLNVENGGELKISEILKIE